MRPALAGSALSSSGESPSACELKTIRLFHVADNQAVSCTCQLCDGRLWVTGGTSPEDRQSYENLVKGLSASETAAYLGASQYCMPLNAIWSGLGEGPIFSLRSARLGTDEKQQEREQHVLRS